MPGAKRDHTTAVKHPGNTTIFDHNSLAAIEATTVTTKTTTHPLDAAQSGKEKAPRKILLSSTIDVTENVAPLPASLATTPPALDALLTLPESLEPLNTAKKMSKTLSCQKN